ncbi:hypothetical protein RR46_00793 [Papilio xuthus]|uniref:Uncharacterized protein n=1 Tax=Papilio xuthus TaxID=66420 RepID=A0A0N0PAT1_PAPXU|nr:hypothetical protein RR46_00793 [Papilio xuthus]
MSYLEVSATTDALADVKFELIRGKTGSRNMVFQLVSNHSDFLAYSYMAYGIREEEYKKVTNMVTLPIQNQSYATRFNCYVPLEGHFSTLTQALSALRSRPGEQTHPEEQTFVQTGSGSLQDGWQPALHISNTSFSLVQGSGKQTNDINL